MATKNDSQLDQLAQQAENLETSAQLDQAAPGVEPGPDQAAQKPTNAQILAGAVAAGRTVFCAIVKVESPKVALSDENCVRLGAVWGPVLDKWRIDLNGMVGDYALELAAVVVTFEIGMNLRNLVAAELAERNQAQSQVASQPGEALAQPSTPENVG